MGGRSVTTIYKREQDKLANEFIAKEDLVAGVPVVLNTDGTISELEPPTSTLTDVPAEGTTSKPNKYLGINLYDVKAGNLTTVMILVSHVMVYAKSVGTVNVSDLVKLSGVKGDGSLPETSYDYSNHLAVTAAVAGSTAHGICLDSDDIQNELRVLVFDTPVVVKP